MNRTILAAVAAVTLGSATLASAAITISPLLSFGGGDGWRSPNEVLAGDTVGSATAGQYRFLGTGSLERGMALNPTNNRLYVLSRNGGVNIRILDASTGVDLGNIDATGISGGTFAASTIRVADDGAIYVANVASPMSSTAPFKVYRFANQVSNATEAFSANILTGARLGDSLDVIGSGANTRIIAGFGTGTATNRNSFVHLTTSNGLNYVANDVVLTANPGTTLANGDFRLGITFGASSTEIYGTQNASLVGGLKRVTLASDATGNVVDTSQILNATFATSTVRGLDFAVIGGVPLLASAESGTSIVRLHDLTDPNTPVFVAEIDLTGTLDNGNTNGTIAISWGASVNGVAPLYVMNSNNGIQAFTVVVPEPAALGLLAPAALLVARRRRA